jgi:hypothetical protein
MTSERTTDPHMAAVLCSTDRYLIINEWLRLQEAAFDGELYSDHFISQWVSLASLLRINIHEVWHLIALLRSEGDSDFLRQVDAAVLAHSKVEVASAHQ